MLPHIKKNINKTTCVNIDGIDYDIHIFEDETTDFLKDEVFQHSCCEWAGKAVVAEPGHSIALEAPPINNSNDPNQKTQLNPLGRSVDQGNSPCRSLAGDVGNEVPKDQSRGPLIDVDTCHPSQPTHS